MKAGLCSWVSGLAMLVSFAPRAVAAAPVYRVTGVVLSQRDGAAVAHCRISATPAGASQAAQDQPGVARPGAVQRFGRSPGGPVRRSTPAYNQLETRADGSGHFSLELPHAGRWRVVAETRGFHAQSYDSHEDYFASIVLTEAAPTYQAEFRLVPDVTISGLVLDEAGDPVSQATVIAERVPLQMPGLSSVVQRPQQVGSAQTDDLGRYELAGLQDGRYRVRVQAQPWYASGSRSLGGNARAAPGSTPDPSLDVVFPVTWFPAALSEDAAETMTLAGGEDRQADFHLTAVPAAHLVVARPPETEPGVGEGGGRRPMRPMSVTRVASDGMYGQASFISGNGSQWDFGNLAPGTYEVRLPGTATGPAEEVRQVEVRPGSTEVTLENARALTPVKVTFAGAGAAAIPFTMFIDTETGRRISAFAPSRLRGARGHRGELEADDEGEAAPLTMTLPPHRYLVAVGTNGGAYLSSITGSGAKIVGHTVEIGDVPAALTLHVASGRGEISGTVRLAGREAEGAMVLLVPASLGQTGSGAFVQRDESNTDGSFDLAGLIPGRYILVAIDHGWRTDWRSPHGLARYLSQGVPVEIAADGKVQRDLVAVLP